MLTILIYRSAARMSVTANHKSTRQSRRTSGCANRASMDLRLHADNFHIAPFAAIVSDGPEKQEAPDQ